MGYMVYTQGEDHILSTYFTGTTFTGPFYIGLGTGPLPVIEHATLNDIVEVEGLNYSRQQVQRSSNPYGWSIVDGTAQAAQVSWINQDLVEAWTPADYAFLTLSPTGVDDPNILIAAVDLNDTVVLQPDRKMRIIFKFSQL